ncbi:MAG: MmcQ/YjbR family DNA-binding protein [Clostridia bacterium]|nr:MmcQ/YjbR family DNA-binding protein [Clostridia bacterium]
MNNLTAKIFKNKIFNAHKLTAYGFELCDGFYRFETAIADGQFCLKIKINESEIFADVYEKDTGDAYTLFLVEEAAGSFVGLIRAEYQKALSEIAEKCFDKYVFKSKQSAQVIEYARKTYGDELEFLWEKFSDNAVLRRKDNNKWYAAILTVAGNKLGFASLEKVEVLDLRADPEIIQKTVDNKKFFNGYHMNKKHWITVCLDGTVEIETIYKMIDDSYSIANKK